MSRLQSLLTENSKGNLIPLNELRDVLENDVQLWRDGDGKIDAGLLELFNLHGIILAQLITEAGVDDRFEIPESLNKWLHFKGRPPLGNDLQLINILQELVTSWTIEVMSPMVRSWFNAQLFWPQVSQLPNSFHSLEEMIDSTKHQVEFWRRDDFEYFSVIFMRKNWLLMTVEEIQCQG